MPILLAIHVSPRFENSVSRKLTVRFIEQWTAAHSGGEVIHRDLMKTALRFIDESFIAALFTPIEQRSAEMKEAIRTSDELIAELMTADHVVIGTPMFNFSIPAILKAYIDHIVRVGSTVTMGYEGVLQGKKATIILASGSSFAAGTKWETSNNASSYLKQILAFVGIQDITTVLAGNTRVLETGETTFADFAAQFDGELSSAAGM